jgi:hypothetical protein
MRGGEKGYIALITVLIVGAVATAISVALMLSGADSQRASTITQNSTGARGLVSACAEEALQVIHDNTSFTGSGNLTLGPGTCTYNVTTLGGNDRIIDVSGTVNATVRRAQLSITIGSSITINYWQDIASLPALVQIKVNEPQSNTSSVAAAFTSNQTAGNTNVVIIGWTDATTNITSVADSAGNTYQVAAAVTRGTGVSQAIYYAKNIAAGANTITVTFNTNAVFPDLRVMEYSGVDTVGPLNAAASASGSSTSASSGSLTTTVPTTLIVGGGTAATAFSAAGSGYLSRSITPLDTDIVEDRTAAVSNSYTATASLASGAWVMQAAAFKAAGQ